MAQIKQTLLPLPNTDSRVQFLLHYQGNLRRQWFVVIQIGGAGPWYMFVMCPSLRRAVKNVQNVGNQNVGAIILLANAQFYLWQGPVP